MQHQGVAGRSCESKGLADHLSTCILVQGGSRANLCGKITSHICAEVAPGPRQQNGRASELTSHYLFEDRVGRPGKGNDKGKVENLVGYARRNYLVPLPRAATFEELNAQLEARCRRRFDDRLRGHDATIGSRLAADQAAFLDLPAVP